MNIILLSGGAGKRLWPLTNDIRAKQFIKIFQKADGSYESMIQRVFRQIRSVDADARVTIATSKPQISSIFNQIGKDVSISLEPCRRNTFPAIVLASLYMRDVEKVSEDEPVVVCPVDPYVDHRYFEALRALSDLAALDTTAIALMGIQPTYPSEKYGYIIPENLNEVCSVVCFKEKPDKETAEKLIKSGALWNGGVFAYKLRYLINRAHELIGFTDYDDLLARYDTLPNISFDYAVIEKERNLSVMRFAGEWKDMGTWNTLTEEMSDNAIGNVIFDDACENTKVVNELNTPVLCMGLKDVIVAASQEGILVSDAHASSKIKPYVEAIVQQIMFAEKSWGQYSVIDVEQGSLTIKVTLMPGNQMHYHSHRLRDEIWSVISGMGWVILDGDKRAVAAGDVIRIPIGCKHTVIADTTLKLIEVQLGENIDVSDKEKF